MFPVGLARAARRSLLASTATAAVTLSLTGPAWAATFTVNGTGDQPDALLADDPNACDVDPGSPGSQCTLRAAIQEANATSGADDITFSIPGGGVQTITPGSGLPPILERTRIDGYTQPGASPNTLPLLQGDDAVILIEIDGSSAGDVVGPEIAGGTRSVIRGLAVHSFRGTQVSINEAQDGTVTGNRIEGNFIGTDADGDEDLNPENALIVRTPGNTVGGTSPGDRNLLVGGFVGLDLQDDSNVVQGNYIGPGRSGTAPTSIGNTVSGVLVRDPENVIGGEEEGAGNLIRDNGGSIDGSAGIAVSSAAIGVDILGNSIEDNARLGIDLGQNGRTENDPGKDKDSGANGLQNFPVLTSASEDDGRVRVRGSLQSRPNRTFLIEVFANEGSEREGERLLGRVRVRTNDRGRAWFALRVDADEVISDGTITATATGREGTSEFSDPLDEGTSLSSALPTRADREHTGVEEDAGVGEEESGQDSGEESVPDAGAEEPSGT